MTTNSQETVLILGAGIVGVSTALWLQRSHRRVILVDKKGPAAGASYGNAGVLAAGAVVPVTVPGLIRRSPKLLMNPNSPLFLRWSYLPRLFPFLRKYLAHANARDVETTAEGLHQLLHDAPDQHLALAQETKAAQYISNADYLYGYADQASFDADSFVWATKAKQGVDFVPMTASDLVAFDPALKDRFGYGVRCRGHGAISDPGAYVKALAEQFQRDGGTIMTAEFSEFQLESGRCIGLATSEGTLIADKYVLAAGAWSSNWATTLGVSVLLESERGYHIEFVDPSITLRAPIMVAGGSFVVNSMKGRMRCAGVVEFGGLHNPPSKAPFNLLRRQMADLFPDLTYTRIDEWMGHRPATTDSLPVIGVAPKANNVWLGYGHHHVGLTGGPKTGRWLAQMIIDEPINEDLSAFSPSRTG